MKSCGIIVEYNPFHNGHQYHAEMARKLSGAEVIIAVMSGNFLQRGEPAIIDKWDRAESALENGVDLVIELPFSWSVQAADYFAEGGIKILQALGCESLCFGTDSQVSFDYAAYGAFFVDREAELDQYFQQLPEGLSYPEKMAQVVGNFFPELKNFPPNLLLALSYAKENAKYPQPMALFPLPRKDQGYHEADLIENKFASATGIRQAVFAEKNISDFVPVVTEKKLLQQHYQWQDFWPYLNYQLTVNTTAQLRKIYQMKEGLEHRLKKNSAKDFQEYLQKLKTKRYTQPRLQRLLTYLLLQVTPEEIKKEQEQTMLHVLGFTEAGQRFLNQHKKDFSLPLAAKIGQKEQQAHFLTYRGDQVYQLLHSVEQNLGRLPLRK